MRRVALATPTGIGHVWDLGAGCPHVARKRAVTRMAAAPARLHAVHGVQLTERWRWEGIIRPSCHLASSSRRQRRRCSCPGIRSGWRRRMGGRGRRFTDGGRHLATSRRRCPINSRGRKHAKAVVGGAVARGTKGGKETPRGGEELAARSRRLQLAGGWWSRPWRGRAQRAAMSVLASPVQRAGTGRRWNCSGGRHRSCSGGVAGQPQQVADEQPVEPGEGVDAVAPCVG
jgi:hypothetical protein